MRLASANGEQRFRSQTAITTKRCAETEVEFDARPRHGVHDFRDSLQIGRAPRTIRFAGALRH
jgi:hypothetical protein